MGYRLPHTRVVNTRALLDGTTLISDASGQRRRPRFPVQTSVGFPGRQVVFGLFSREAGPSARFFCGQAQAQGPSDGHKGSTGKPKRKDQGLFLFPLLFVLPRGRPKRGVQVPGARAARRPDLCKGQQTKNHMQTLGSPLHPRSPLRPRPKRFGTHQIWRKTDVAATRLET